MPPTLGALRVKALLAMALLVLALMLTACGGSATSTDQPDNFVWDGAGYVGVHQGDKTTDVVVSVDALTWTTPDAWPNAVASLGLCPDGFDCSSASTPDGRVAIAVAAERAIMSGPDGVDWLATRGGVASQWNALPGHGPIVSTGTNFWTDLDGAAMVSSDAQNWSLVPLDGERTGRTSVAATAPFGHVALTTCDSDQCEAMFSHDDGATWSARIPMTDSMEVIGVGPSGLLMHDWPLSTERRASLMDFSGELARTTTIGSDLPINGVVDAVGALVTQPRSEGAPLIWRLNK